MELFCLILKMQTGLISPQYAVAPLLDAPHCIFLSVDAIILEPSMPISHGSDAASATITSLAVGKFRHADVPIAAQAPNRYANVLSAAPHKAIPTIVMTAALITGNKRLQRDRHAPWRLKRFRA